MNKSERKSKDRGRVVARQPETISTCLVYVNWKLIQVEMRWQSHVVSPQWQPQTTIMPSEGIVVSQTKRDARIVKAESSVTV